MSIDPLYFDYAAATPVADRVLEQMRRFEQDVFYNPSALYTPARVATAALDEARQLVAESIGARSSEVIFTAGGSESTNLAVSGVMRQYPDGNIVVSAIEHDAVLEPARQYDCRQLGVDESGRIIIDQLDQLVDKNTVLISIMLVNNEIGVVQDISRAVEWVASQRRLRAEQGNTTPLLLHTDACQAPLYIDVNVHRHGVDLMTLNGGKMYGPKQSGLLYVRAGVVLAPQIRGGGQEFGLRSGTENVAQAVGFAHALQAAQEQRKDRAQTIAGLRDDLMNRLEEMNGVSVNGSRKHRIANNVHITLTGSDNERMIFALDEKGIMVAAGSACSASKETPSHVLRAIGKTDQQAQSSLRLSLGDGTTKASIKTLVENISRCRLR